MLTRRELRIRNGINVNEKLLVDETGDIVFTSRSSDIGPNKIQFILSMWSNNVIAIKASMRNSNDSGNHSLSSNLIMDTLIIITNSIDNV